MAGTTITIDDVCSAAAAADGTALTTGTPQHLAVVDERGQVVLALRLDGSGPSVPGAPLAAPAVGAGRLRSGRSRYAITESGAGQVVRFAGADALAGGLVGAIAIGDAALVR